MKNKTRCPICPKGCTLNPDEFGDCRVRKNIDGVIRCVTYGQPCSLNIDPVEKKPLYHFRPGSLIFSVGTAGCNLHCQQCQNWQISQSNYTTSQSFQPLEVVEAAISRNCQTIAYTYAEPLVSYEYTLDCCRRAQEMGVKNVLVTAAFINPDPLLTLCKYVDAANVDLKSFSDSFYRTICDAHLEPVLAALKIMKTSGVMLEITNLLIPTLNDSVDETKRLSNWIVENLGVDTPLHFSRFYPQNRLKHLPPTPEETILQAREIATNSGLNFVYVGNMTDRAGESTQCPACEKLLIERNGYLVLRNHLINGKCPNCNEDIYGIWK